ncbi:probable inactive purple acid phosphatase 28 isoform X1 [Ipomoea triloba]|uniref:probable inactive purple acid phosphatase 28 isoform X1 n=1 Tax=Ipomoea triloba TaxID=35885 RepID=UPI00125D72DA|nr:probable inactive purple acid phosphatase 28 isoform X1 [Ipomoea triloba]XP_031106937.1 probable inactive purple acid phosphatase 28 isoform X1 [Ipomoea triloba]XP_031106938.1 probable inactive purple acid phosphatase 28 isoform X2 [Ipomoea triloba]XP_031106939.1 probable inactive purple acid phosphatase 28 isoform X1 [Ipomoea triloba]
MESSQWIHSLFFLLLVIAALHLLHTLTLAPRLTVNHRNARLKKQPDLPLRFRSHDGTFKILQVADMHYGNGKVTRCRDVLETEFDNCSDLNSTSFLRKLIQLEKPDLVVFTGDNIFGTSATDAAESMFEVFGPVIESGLPWAAVLGNHDQESTMNREELMSFISLMDYSVSQTFPAVEDMFDPTKQKPMTNIDGFGNYNLRIWGAPGSYLSNSSIFNLYFLDSGDRAIVDGFRTYGWIKESQLSWLRSVSKRFQGQLLNDNHLADIPSFPILHPAVAFFHIPIPEIRQGPVKGVVGKYSEYIACSVVNSGVLKTLVSMGDVKAVFIGHDHKNDFCGNLDGIWFCYGGGFGYHGYGIAGWPRRARVILAELEKGEKTWMGVEKIKTWKRLDDEMLSKIDEQVLWDRQSSK